VSGNEHPHAASGSTSPEPVLPTVNPAIDKHATPETGLPFPIVCIGASAGGLNAVSDLLVALPSDLDMSFVVIQHLDPSHASMLPEILGRASSLPALEVENHMPIEPRRVYVIPPGKTLVLGDGLLQLAPRTEMRGQHRPIDHFMRSLAEEHGDKAIG
jgi:two-component system CheB/CheR fusion protein